MTSVSMILFIILISGLFIWMLRSSLINFLAKLLRPQKLERIYYEDALKHIFKLENAQLSPSLQSVAGQLEVSGERAAMILDESSLTFKETSNFVTCSEHTKYS